MGESLVFQKDTTDLEEHPAVVAWSALDPTAPTPVSIDVLRTLAGMDWKKSALYRLNGVGQHGAAVIAKAAPSQRMAVERVIYEDVLPRLSVTSLRYYGFWDDLKRDLSWLFVEDAGGEKYREELAGHRLPATAWFSTMHTETSSFFPVDRLPPESPAHHLPGLQSARAELREILDESELTRDQIGVLESIVEEFDGIESRWVEIEDFCSVMPRCLVHGDLIGKNLRVRTCVPGSPVYVLDWETAAWGVPAVDIAPLDPDAYWSRVRSCWWGMSLESVRRLAQMGRILMSVDMIEAFCNGFRREWPDETVWNLEFYGTRLAAARSAAGLV